MRDNVTILPEFGIPPPKQLGEFMVLSVGLCVFYESQNKKKLIVTSSVTATFD